MTMFSSHLAAPILVCVVFLICTRECSTSVPALNNPCRLSGVLTFIQVQKSYKKTQNAPNLTYNASIILKCFITPKVLKNTSIIYLALAICIGKAISDSLYR